MADPMGEATPKPLRVDIKSNASSHIGKPPALGALYVTVGGAQRLGWWRDSVHQGPMVDTMSSGRAYRSAWSGGRGTLLVGMSDAEDGIQPSQARSPLGRQAWRLGRRASPRRVPSALRHASSGWRQAPRFHLACRPVGMR